MGLRRIVQRSLPEDSFLYNALALLWGIGTFSRRRIKGAYRRYARDGIFMEEEELFMCSLLPRHALDVVLDALRPASLLDVGCGTGQALRYLADRSVDCWGVEGSAVAIEHSTMPDRIRQADLRRPVDLARRFDVAWSFEVAEHLHREHADVFLDTLARHSDQVVMSAARPGQGGEGHFNCQPPEYWIEKMRRRGYSLDDALTSRLRAAEDQWASNLMAFRRRADVR
jgi:SAM-dependent methyltransferase